MSSLPPTAPVVEKAAPNPVVVGQAPAPTALVNPAVVETIEPAYVNKAPRKTAHKRWLIPFWLTQLPLFLLTLIGSGMLLNDIRNADARDKRSAK